LVNLIVDSEIVKELLQDNVTTIAITAELESILEDEVHRNKILAGYKKLRSNLQGDNASKNTANEIFEIVSAQGTDFT